MATKKFLITDRRIVVNEFESPALAPRDKQRTHLHGALDEVAFHRMISLERRRTVRSRKSFLLMLLEVSDPSATRSRFGFNKKILSALSTLTRETDVTGWYREGLVMGVMFTEISADEVSSITATIMKRVSLALTAHLSPEQFSSLNLSFHPVPERKEDALPGREYSAAFSSIETANPVSEPSL